MLVKAAVVNEKGGEIKFEDVSIGTPQANEVLIRIVATGICHTELGVQHQHIETPLPIALGHEGAGIIESLGPGVTEFEIGDHVVISFSYCGSCKTCLEGHPNSCEHFGSLNFGGKMLDGTTRLSTSENKVFSLFGQSSLATYAIAHKNNVVKVDKSVDLTILGPLACGIQTGAGTVFNKLQPGFGESIAIFGCGGVGLSAIMAATLTSCTNVIAIDVNEDRLRLALELGATHIINARNQDVNEEILNITGSGVEYAIESTGISDIVLQGVRALRTKGTLAVVGVSGNTTIHIHDDLIPPNRTIVGITQGDSIPKLFIPKLIETYKNGKFPFDRLIKKYSFNELNEALEDMRIGKTVKPVIVFDEV